MARVIEEHVRSDDDINKDTIWHCQADVNHTFIRKWGGQVILSGVMVLSETETASLENETCPFCKTDF